MIKRYFENIPAQPAPAPADMSEPEQKAERRKTVEDGFAQTPRLDIVFKIPPANTPDWYALEMLGQVLSSGVSSRLYQKFVKEKEIALSVYADAEEKRGPSLFWFSLMARPTADLARAGETALRRDPAHSKWSGGRFGVEQSPHAAAPPTGAATLQHAVAG